jgi:hypothetical protein
MKMKEILQEWVVVSLLSTYLDGDFALLSCINRSLRNLSLSYSKSCKSDLRYLSDISPNRPHTNKLATLCLFPSSLAETSRLKLNKATIVPDSHFYLKYLGSWIGWGIFTAKVVPQGTEILSYVGEFIGSAERHKRHSLRSSSEVWATAVRS